MTQLFSILEGSKLTVISFPCSALSQTMLFEKEQKGGNLSPLGYSAFNTYYQVPTDLHIMKL